VQRSEHEFGAILSERGRWRERLKIAKENKIAYADQRRARMGKAEREKERKLTREELRVEFDRKESNIVEHAHSGKKRWRETRGRRSEIARSSQLPFGASD